MATAVAFSIDYNLFILTRYQEELKIQSDPEIIVASVVHMSRHTVLVSGAIITVCFMLNFIFQNAILTGCGFGAAITVIFCICANLTLTPCILLQWHSFFSKCHESDYIRFKKW